MTFLSNLKEKRERKARFGIKPKEVKKVIIPPRLIESIAKDLVQWCNKCSDTVPHERITFDKGKRAFRCTHCVKITLIATEK